MIIATLALAAGIHHHDGCTTMACERRVDGKEHAKTVHRWRRTARPYRAWLASTRWCESRGHYATNTGNGFFGAYQFTLGSWSAVGGRVFFHRGRIVVGPHTAAPVEQDYRAVRLLHVQGRGAWPVCG